MPRALVALLALFASPAFAQTFQGQLPGDTTWSGTITMAGDVIVPAGVTLTVQPGTAVTANATDSLGNADPTVVELIVRGTLNVAGVQGGGVTFTGAGSGPSAWGGIRVEEGGQATISAAQLDECKLGLEVRGGSSAVAITTLTVSNSTLRSSTACLVTAGSAGAVTTSVTGTTIDGCTQSAVRQGYGTTTVTGSILTNTSPTSSGGAVVLVGGSITLDHTTVAYNSSRGFYSCGALAGASFTATSSIFSHNTSHAFYRAAVNSPDFCGGVLPTFSVTNSNVWGNSNSYGPPPGVNANNLAAGSVNTNTALGAGVISANPLFLDGAARNFRLTQRSPSRKTGAGGTDMGPLPYTTDATPGNLQGTLWEDLTVTAPIPVDGDVTVADGVTLTLQPGVTLTFAATDSMGSADTALRGELIVEGTLTSVGVSGSPIVLTGTGTGPSVWQGVRLQHHGSATLANVTLDDMSGGLEVRGSTGETATLTLSNSTLRNSNACLVTAGTSGTVNASVSGTTFDGCGTGAIRHGFGTTTVAASVLTNTSASASGAVVLSGGSLALDRTAVSYNQTRGYYSCGATGGSFTATSSIFSHNASHAFYRAAVNSPDFCGGVLPAFSVTQSNVWGNSNSYGPPPGVNANNLAAGSVNTNTALGSGVISANPLFLDGAARNFRLTQRSPSRKTGAGGVDMGPLPYTTDATPGNLQGTLWEDLVVSTPLAVDGDLTVSSGVTLTLQPGVTLTFAATDSMGSADTALRGELIVEGTLASVGTLGSPIALTANGAGPGLWQGVRVQHNGGATLANVTLDEMNGGLEVRGSASESASLNLSGSTLRGSNACLSTSGAGTVTANVSGTLFDGCGAQGAIRSGTGTVTVGTSVLTNTSASASGAVVLSGGTLTMDRCTVSFNQTRGYYSCGATGGSFTATSSIFSQNASHAFYRAAVNSPDFCGGVLPAFSVTYSDVWGNSNSYGPPPGVNANNLAPGSVNTNTALGAGVISANPLFVNEATRDFHLTSTSPPRGTGAGGVDQGAFPFSVGPVATVVVTPMAPSVAAGGVIGFAATAYDASSNVVPGVTFTWSAAPAAGTISSTGVLTAGCTPGTYLASITAQAPNAVSGTAGVTLVVGAAANITIAPASPSVGSQATRQFTATVVDSCNNPLPSAPVTFTAVAAAGGITSGGLFTAGCQRGLFTNGITATSGTLSRSTNVTVAPGAVVAIALVPLNVAVQAGTTQQFGASAADGCGNTVNGVTFTWATTIAGSSIDGTGLFLAGQNNGTFGGGVTVSTPGATGTVTASATVTVQGGSGSTVASVTVAPPSATLQPNGTVTFSATARNSGGTVLSGLPVSWSVASGGGSITADAGVFTAGTLAGTFTDTVHATVSGVDGTATVVVQPGPVSVVEVNPTSATVAPSGQASFTAVAKDAFGNVISNAAVTWSASAAAGTITQGGVFTAGIAPGTYPAAVTATVGSVNGTASVTVQVGALSSLAVAPSAATIEAGGSRAFTATGRDVNGNTVAITPVWSVAAGGGTINGSGIFTAGTSTGTFPNTVKVEAQGLSAFATVVVTAGPAIAIDVSPASVQLDAGAQQLFSAAARDAFNNSVAASFTWSAQATAGTITQGGLFTAGSEVGLHPNAVTASFNSITGNASVQVLGGGASGGGAGGASGGGAGGGVAGGDGGGAAGGTGGGGGAAGGVGATGGGSGGATGGGGGEMMTKSGCGCGQSGLPALIFLVLLPRLRQRRLRPSTRQAERQRS